MVADKTAVLVERDGAVVTLTLNRPDAMNSVNAELATALGTALVEADADTTVAAVIVTGAGERAFCAGADLKALSRGESIAAEGHPEWGFGGFVRNAVSVPVIAAVNGFALGGGTELVLASDLAVAADTAAFGLPEVSRGIIAAGGGAIRLSAALPPKVAHELLFTGRKIDAARALELDLVNRVVPADQVLATARALAAEIAVNAPLAVRATKRLARAITDGAFREEAAAWEQNTAESVAIRGTEDAVEGTTAFAQKRAPQWRGR